LNFRVDATKGAFFAGRANTHEPIPVVFLTYQRPGEAGRRLPVQITLKDVRIQSALPSGTAGMVPVMVVKADFLEASAPAPPN
jgi:hypothetical protein